MGKLAHEHLVRRVEGEYLEMPGLRLTCEQAQRLWGVDSETCRAILDALVARNFLVRGPDARYRRTFDGARPHMLRTTLESNRVLAPTRRKAG